MFPTTVPYLRLVVDLRIGRATADWKWPATGLARPPQVRASGYTRLPVPASRDSMYGKPAVASYAQVPCYRLSPTSSPERSENNVPGILARGGRASRRKVPGG